MTKRLFDALTVLALLAAALLSLPRVWQAGQVNLWSRNFVVSGALSAPPEAHLRAPYWQAAARLAAGDAAGAESLLAGRGDVLSLHLLSDIFLAGGRFDEAAALWQKTDDFESLLKVASRAAQAGALDAARGAYRAAYALNVEVASLPLAAFELNNKNTAAAEEILRRALGDFPVSPRRAGWVLRLGDVLRAEQRWPEAEALYLQVLAGDPQNWQAHFGLGWVLYERGDGLEAALSEFEQVIAIDESRGRGQAAIGQVLAREGRFAEAEGWFAQAIALDPDVQWWYTARAAAARQSGNLPLALTVLQEALRCFPEAAPLYFELAATYQRMGEQDAARQSIERALTLEQTPTLSYLLRAASIYEWTGDKAKALAFYRLALTIDPQDESALRGAARLGQ
ncbi:MAG: hypothetical protein Fur0035_18550 [Anaerolineales bacterium]